MIWTYFDKLTGRVMGKRHGPAMDAPMRGNLGLIEGDYSKDWWIDPASLTPQPLEDMGLKVSANAIDGVPEGCVLSRAGVPVHTAAGGLVEIAARYDETIVLELSHPRHRRTSVTVACSGSFVPAGPDVMRLEQDVQHLRAMAYPSIGDQLDAIWKGGADAEAMMARVRAVKKSLPKT